MRQPEPVEETLDSFEAEKQFKRILTEVKRDGTRTIIEEDGQPVAVIMSIDDLREMQREADFRVFREIGELFKDEPLEKIEEEVNKAVREVREERYLRSIEGSSQQ